MAHWHDFNPWATEIVYVPNLEELAACIAGGKVRVIKDNQPDEVLDYSVEYIVERWLNTSRIRGTPNRLDAYLLEDGPNSRVREIHAGVRYGAEPSEYFSPRGRQNDLRKLLEKYS